LIPQVQILKIQLYILNQKAFNIIYGKLSEYLENSNEKKTKKKRLFEL